MAVVKTWRTLFCSLAKQSGYLNELVECGSGGIGAKIELWLRNNFSSYP